MACALLLLPAALLVAGASAAQGGGPSLYEVGTPDMGLSAAGAAARARDAATAYTNPAGMTRLEGVHVLAGAYALWVIQDLELDAAGTVSDPPGSTDGGGRQVGFQPGLGTYAVVPLAADWRLGLALNAPFAGGAKYDDGWVGRAFVVESELLGVNLEPSLAYAVDEALSLGLGLNVFVATFRNERRADNTAGAPLTELEADDVGLGFTLAALWTPRERTRVGLVWRSAIDVALEGDFDDGAGTTLDATLDFTVPQGVTLALREELTPDLALHADLGWTDWSEFSEQTTTVGPGSASLDRAWDDTWRVGLGAELRLDQRWLLQAGVGYDSSAVDDDVLLPDIPFQDSWRWSVGCQLVVSARSTLGLTYTFMDRGHPELDTVALPPSGAVVLDGEFEESTRHFVGVTWSWRR